ncbi:MAG: hypothetical protein HOO99_06180, partial [Hyphomicrobiaceae bacterium]|nr:hypothetical protein [Hyphomicrobiaceae bacterium]
MLPDNLSPDDGRPELLLGMEATAHVGITAAMMMAHETATNAGWYRDPKTGLSIERNVGEV